MVRRSKPGGRTSGTEATHGTHDGTHDGTRRDLRQSDQPRRVTPAGQLMRFRRSDGTARDSACSPCPSLPITIHIFLLLQYVRFRTAYRPYSSARACLEPRRYRTLSTVHRVRVGFSEVSNFYKIRPIFKGEQLLQNKDFAFTKNRRNFLRILATFTNK